MKIRVQIQCPKCGKRLAFQKEESVGGATVTCPGCKSKLRAKFDTSTDPQTCLGIDIPEAASAPAPAPKKSVQAKTTYFPPVNPGVPPVPGNPGEPTGNFKPGNGFNGPEIPGQPFYPPTGHSQPAQQDGPRIPANAYLTRKQGLFHKERFQLFLGKTLVGRFDLGRQSDIAITDDPTISRQSIEIEIQAENYGLVYRLTVLNCANPVKVNMSTLYKGDTRILYPGDVIILGSTKLTFEV